MPIELKYFCFGVDIYRIFAETKINIMNEDTQKTAIKNHLLEGNSITPIDALKLFGSFRLGARIFQLREEGMNIKTELIHEGRKRFAKYSIG